MSKKINQISALYTGIIQKSRHFDIDIHKLVHTNSNFYEANTVLQCMVWPCMQRCLAILLLVNAIVNQSKSGVATQSATISA